jgi:hypothetical protein
MSIELIDWAAIFTLACVLKRKVAITRTSGFLGSWDCYPFLYIIVVGPSGVGKTTTIKYSFDLTDQIPSLAKPPTFATMEGIIDDLVKAPDNAIYLSVEELEDIMQKDYNRKMFGFLTSLYDGKTNIRQKTLSRDLEFADKPCLNMFAGTTPEWVGDNIPPGILNGGFGSRVIWLYVPGLRRRKMYYKEEMKDKDYNKIEKMLVADLNHIATCIEGDYTISDEAREYVENWNTEIPNKIKYKKIAGYIMRKNVFVHKLAILMHVAYSDSMELNLLDFKNAITMIENLEPNLPMIFEGVGKNEYSLEMRDIAKYVLENPGVSDEQLRQDFRNAAGPAKLHELIEGLLIAGILRSEMDESINKRIFFIQED